MFKRVERRQKRKEDEAELGLDEEMKEVMGLQDTDSSESESESESSSDSGSSSSDKGAKHGSTQEGEKRKREKKEGEDEENGFAEEEASEEESDDDDSDDEGDEPIFTVSFALQQPVRPVSLDRDENVCIVCPGKMLKNSTMIKVHEGSKAHQRRFRRVQELAMDSSPDADIRKIILKIDAEGKIAAPVEETAQSKRAEKRKAKQAKIKAIREKRQEAKLKAIAVQKAKQLAANAAASPSSSQAPPKTVKSKSESQSRSEGDGEERMKKRRKLDKLPPKPKGAKPRYFEEDKPAKVRTSSRGNHPSTGKKGAEKKPEKGKSKRKENGGGEEVLQVFD